MNAIARFLALMAVLALAACGGGMQAGVGSGGSGAPMSVSVGSVSGFGSIIVNGTHYDETTAEVQLDERPDRPTAATVDVIRLGMHIELQHRNLVISKATVGAELIGPVASVSASSFVALGQTVLVNPDPVRPTVFEGFGALVDLASGAVVEVHGDRSDSGEILATRVELKPAALNLVRLAGTATNVNGRSFTVGGLSIDAASATLVPGGAVLSNGLRVVLWTDVPYTGGVLVPKVVRIGDTTIVNNAAVVLDGVVAAFQSSGSFRVDGIGVNAASATFVGGTATNLANGVPVRVRGTFNNGVLQAASVEFLQAAQARSELTGPITDFVDAAAPFRIRNSLVRVTAQTTYSAGTVANLGSGVVVRLTGTLVNGVVEATTVEFLPLAAGATRAVVGAIGAPLSPVAADGSRTFRLDGLTVEVRTATGTAYRNGAAADVALGRRVKVKGGVQGSQFVADEVQFLDNPASPPNLNIDGTASSVQATSVVVSGQTVQLNGFTVYTLNGAPSSSASLIDGLYVEIVATRSASVLTAQSVEIKSPSSTTTRVRGLVSGRTPANATQFMVGNQRVSVAGNPMLVPGNKTLADIVDGSDIEVDGTVAGGVLSATRIKFR